MAQMAKESACRTGDLGLIPGLGRFPRGRLPNQYSDLENPMDYDVMGSQKCPRRLIGFHSLTLET